MGSTSDYLLFSSAIDEDLSNGLLDTTTCFSKNDTNFHMSIDHEI